MFHASSNVSEFIKFVQVTHTKLWRPISSLHPLPCSQVKVSLSVWCWWSSWSPSPQFPYSPLYYHPPLTLRIIPSYSTTFIPRFRGYQQWGIFHHLFSLLKDKKHLIHSLFSSSKLSSEKDCNVHRNSEISHFDGLDTASNLWWCDRSLRKT